MIEWINQLGIVPYIFICLGISSVGLCFVYIPGRMLGIVESYRTKNTIALVTILLFSVFYVYAFQEHDTIEQYVYIFFIYFSISIIIYVVIGMRLFDRIDTFMDKKFAEDKGDIYTVPPKRKRAKRKIK